MPAFAEQQNNLAGPADPSEIYRNLDPSQRNGLDAAEHSYAVHLYSVPEVNTLASFDWHPTVSERLALFSAQEKRMVHSQAIAAPKKISIINLREDVTSAIGAGGDFVISGGRKLNFESSEGYLSESTENNNIGDMEKLFKRRILAGYGYGNTLNPSSTLLEYSRKAIEEDPLASEDLRFCWDWLWMLFQSSDASEVQKNYGTMFAGVKHILKGTKSSSTIKQDEITYRNRIFVNEKRLKILRMCNWPNYAVRDECKARFDEIAEQGGGVSGITRAAALALFSVQGLLSKEHLTHLSEYTHSREFAETAGHSADFVANYQQMAETVLNVLQKYDGVRVPDYENVCEKLVGDDYLLAIVKFLARRDKIYNRIYNEIFESKMALKDKLAFAAIHMDDDFLGTALEKLVDRLTSERPLSALLKMALKDKLAFAAIHMDDDFLGTALEKLVDRLTSERPLSALLVIGLDDQPESHQLLHRYLDQTGDLQTVSLLLATGNCFRKCAMLQGTTVTSSVGVKASELLESAIESEARGNLRRKSLHCFRDYVQLLNRWKFWLAKTFICLFLRPKNGTGEVDRSKVTSVQAVIACNFCALPIYPTIAERIENLRVYTPKIASFSRRLGPNSRTRTMSCLCRKPLPKCVICRKHLGNALEPESGQCDEGNAASVIDHWVVWCSSCSHGGHLAHVRDWFSEYPMCAASGCECNCVKRDHQLRDELIGSSFGTGEDCQ
uniref:Zinc_ribbon_16 domain-containing protein n=1 Tax=Globodera pallida TaxID=36090 RepID=A0A183CKT9_GLOPA